ncbi:MAG: hypothetical protein Q9201_003091 [Fulgogasparrea decipioides]
MSSRFPPRGNGDYANRGRGSFEFNFHSSSGETGNPFYDRGPSAPRRRGGELHGRESGSGGLYRGRGAYIPGRGRGVRITLEQHLRSQDTGVSEEGLAPGVDPEPATFTWEPPTIPPFADSPVPDHLRHTVYLPAPGSHVSAREKFERLSRQKREEEARERHVQEARQRRNARLVNTSAPASTSTYTELAGRGSTHRWMKPKVGSVLQTGKPAMPSQTGADIISQAIEWSGVGEALPHALEPSRKRQRELDIHDDEDFDDQNFIEDYPDVDMSGMEEANVNPDAISIQRPRRGQAVAGGQEDTNWDEFQPTLPPTIRRFSRPKPASTASPATSPSMAPREDMSRQDPQPRPSKRQRTTPPRHTAPAGRNAFGWGNARAVQASARAPSFNIRGAAAAGRRGRRRNQVRQTAEVGAATVEQLEGEEDEVEIIT